MPPSGEQYRSVGCIWSTISHSYRLRYELKIRPVLVTGIEQTEPVSRSTRVRRLAFTCCCMRHGMAKPLCRKVEGVCVATGCVALS